MNKKYVFIDMDGTLIDKGNMDILESTKLAIRQAQQNGHTVILNTGRPPVLFYFIDKLLGLDSFVACNGRYVVVKGEVIYEDPIPTETIHRLVRFFDDLKIDIAFESVHDFVLQSQHDVLYKKFSEHFNLQYPRYEPNYYKSNDIYQVCLYYNKDDFNKFEKIFPTLSFHFFCKYGLDVNAKGGMKDLGVKKVVEHLNINPLDTIAIGDGYNDISMIKEAHIGIAMGNAPDAVKKHADLIANQVGDDAIYHIFKTLNLIE